MVFREEKENWCICPSSLQAYASDDTALFREITQKFYAKGHNLTGVFNQIARSEACTADEESRAFGKG